MKRSRSSSTVQQLQSQLPPGAIHAKDKYDVWTPPNNFGDVSQKTQLWTTASNKKGDLYEIGEKKLDLATVWQKTQ